LTQILTGPRYVHVTGAILTVMFGLIYFTAQNCIRRGTCVKAGFRLFYFFHRQWWWVYILCVVHAPARLLIWFFFPLIFVVADAALAATNKKRPGVLISAHLKNSDVLSLTFQVPEGFVYQAGQYIQLNWAGGPFPEEWHPFTLTSAPEENVLSVNIRSPNNLDWCSALRRRLTSEAPLAAKLKGAVDKPKAGTIVTFSKNLELKSGTIFSRPVAVGDKYLGSDDETHIEETEADDSSFHDSDLHLPEDSAVLKIAGPFGAPAQNVWNFEVIMVVGSGIGVTPFVSILRSMQLRALQRNSMLGRNPNDPPFGPGKGGGGERGRANPKLGPDGSAAYSAKSKEQLADEILPIPRNVRFVWIVRSQAEVEWFYDLLAEVVEGPCKSMLEIDIYLTGTIEFSKVKKLPCANRLLSNKPKWGICYEEMKEQHPGKHVGVFLCGAAAIGKELDDNARIHSDPATTMFTVHKESF